VKRVLQEALLVGIVGAILALIANAASPRGLRLGTNYFPGGKSSQGAATVTTPGTTNTPAVEGLAERFAREGLQLADSNRVSQLFHDPRRQQELIVFIDARSEEHYLEGHIPGAYQFDRFHLENSMPPLVPVCTSAEQIVFYCSGGDCEESEQAAIAVRDSMALPKEKIFVYGGGINEWRSNAMPVEIGARNSGTITNAPAKTP
jgi:rhodanese-related sulfurtransferase